MRSIIAFFYRQHLFGNLITVLLILIGIYSVFTIRKDLFPKVEFDITVITAVFPGASPEQVEKLIVNPIEQSLKEVDGLKKVQSQAIDSRAVITVTLDPDARNTEKTNDDIQRAVDQVEDYPEDAEKPIVLAVESSQTPVIELAITSEALSELQLRDYTKYLADQLSLVNGVAKVSKNAWRRREMQILVDQSRLAQRDISLSQVIDSIRSQNLQLPAGDMTLTSGREKAVKTDGEFRGVEDLMSLSVKANFDGGGTRLSDIANVKEGLEKPSSLTRTNGIEAFKLTILKKEKSDALKTVEAVRRRVAELERTAPEGLKLVFVNDFTYYLKNRISTLSGNMIMGICLVFVILALFFPWKIALVVAIGIPFSMLATITLIQYFGLSINLISLIGLIIVSGMLVDDVVVVVENVYRRLEGGENSETAIIDGTTEMIPAVTASVLTTVAAFGPMLFMSGIFGKFVFQIPLMVILPLGISLFEAFLIAPGHLRSYMGSSLDSVYQSSKGQAKEMKEHWYDRMLPHYRKMISFLIERRYLTLSVFFVFFVLTAVISSQMRFVLFPPDGIYTFFVRVDGEPGATLEEMSALLKPIEEEIRKLPQEELADYTTQIGIQQNDPNDPLTKRASHYAQIRVNLTPEQERVRKVREVVDDLRERTKTPDGVKKLNFQVAQGGPPQGRPISINIYGEDFKTLKALGAEVKKVLASVPGVQDIEDSEVIGKREVTVRPERHKISQVNLTVQDIATTVRAAFAGVVASSSRTLDEEIDLRVQLKPVRAESQVQLELIQIGNREGKLIPLNKIAEFSEEDSRLLIQHEKYKRIFNVSAQVDLNTTTAIKATKEAQEKLKGLLENYPQYEISYGGENEDTAESFGSLGRAFVVAFLLIFMILVLTFQSFLQPVLVLFALPFGFIGVIYALLLHGRPLSFMSMLGIIALAGVIVNNTIVYIDYFNQRRKEGGPLKEILLDAAVTRLRPIVLTSITTVLGLLPTAYGIGGSDGFVQALALSLGWGLMIGSALTVLLFPSILHIVEDLQVKIAGFLKRRAKI